jgi:hypothetical protein
MTFCRYHDQIDRGNVKLVFEHQYLELISGGECYFGLFALQQGHDW